MASRYSSIRSAFAHRHDGANIKLCCTAVGALLIGIVLGVFGCSSFVEAAQHGRTTPVQTVFPLSGDEIQPCDGANNFVGPVNVELRPPSVVHANIKGIDLIATTCSREGDLDVIFPLVPSATGLYKIEVTDASVETVVVAVVHCFEGFLYTSGYYIGSGEYDDACHHDPPIVETMLLEDSKYFIVVSAFESAQERIMFTLNVSYAPVLVDAFTDKAILAAAGDPPTPAAPTSSTKSPTTRPPTPQSNGRTVAFPYFVIVPTIVLLVILYYWLRAHVERMICPKNAEEVTQSSHDHPVVPRSPGQRRPVVMATPAVIPFAIPIDRARSGQSRASTETNNVTGDLVDVEVAAPLAVLDSELVSDDVPFATVPDSRALEQPSDEARRHEDEQGQGPQDAPPDMSENGRSIFA